MSASVRLRYARQYTLAEIGTTGQSRLQSAVLAAGSGDARALAVALDYLARAGVRVDASGGPMDVPSSAEVARIAGRPELGEAAAFLVGALAATENIARITGAPARPITNVPVLAEPRHDDRA
jgi:hypothetical protein